MRAAGVSRETSAAGSDRTQPGRHRPVQQQDQSRVPSPRAATARRVPRRPAGPEPDPDPQSRPAQPRRQRPPPPRQAPWSPPGRTSPPWPSRRCHRTPSGWRRSRCPGRTFSAPAQTPSGIPGPWHRRLRRGRPGRTRPLPRAGRAPAGTAVPPARAPGRLRPWRSAPGDQPAAGLAAAPAPAPARCRRTRKAAPQ